MSKEPFGDKKLDFPLVCQYRIIAENREGIHFVIETVLLEMGVTAPLHPGNQSGGGRYQSFHVEVRVESLDQMNKIDSALRNIVGVKMVL